MQLSAELAGRILSFSGVDSTNAPSLVHGRTCQ